MHKGTVLIEILKSSHHSDEIDYCIKCAEVDALTPSARQELIDTLTNLSIKLAASPEPLPNNTPQRMARPSAGATYAGGDDSHGGLK